MSKYIPFTTEQKERAASVDLEEFLRRRGEKLITSGRDKRLASDHSITIRGCEWFDHATEQGGRAISFVKQFYGLSYPDAMSLLLDDDLGGSYPAAREKEPEPAKLRENLQNAYNAYRKLTNEESGEQTETMLSQYDDVFYRDEEEINCVLRAYASKIGS